MKKNHKRNIIRLSLIVFLVVISVLLYFTGKEHEIFIDNKSININGIEYSYIDTSNIKINNQEFVEVKKNKRKKIIAVGPNHKITLEYKNSQGELISIEKPIKLGFKGDIIINIPALINNKDFISYR